MELLSSVVLGDGDGLVRLLSARVDAVELGLVARHKEGTDGLRDVLDNLSLAGGAVREVSLASDTTASDRISSRCASKGASGEVGSQSRGEGSAAGVTDDSIADAGLGQRAALVVVS